MSLSSKVSVVIPCYNQGEYIRESIASVWSQSYTDWEIIVVNDGSDDPKTVERLASLERDGIQVIHTPNRGVAAARNTGIKAAKGKYILPLDADDRIGVNYLKEAAVFLDKNIDIKVVYCNGEYFEDEEGPILLPEYTPKIMLQQNLIFCSAVYKKSDWLECGGYDEKFLAGWEDWEFWLRMIKNEMEVYKLPTVHFYYRIKKFSRNAALQNEKLKQAEQQLYTKHFDIYLQFYPNPISVVRNYEHLLNEHQQFEHYKKAFYRSKSYRIGNFILYPLKWLARVGKAK
jgi:glycosyltransferase involved in cell wall biosynthesis